MNHIWKTLPDDIIVQHIMPYLYQKQSPILLADIRNYMEYYYTNEFYNYDYNQYVWFSDLINFFTASHRHSTKSVRKLLKRHIIYKNKNDFELFDADIVNIIHETFPDNTIIINWNLFYYTSVTVSWK